MHYNELPTWPRAYSDTNATGVLKQFNQDFIVTELPITEPSGEGEHVWLYIKKDGANTAFVAQVLAEFAGVKEMDVGYAGLKDRYAITEQWFSIYIPKGDTPDFMALQHDEFEVLKQTRHVKKLRRGDLLGNAFQIRLRDITGDKTAIETNIKKVIEHGVPNYFGAQRFGHDGGNVEQGRMMLAREIRVRNSKKKGLYLSAVRSYIFNEILAARIQQGLWGETLHGDVFDDDNIPTAALWGRGRLISTEDAEKLESTIAQQHLALCDGMEHAGLNQERRAVAAIPKSFEWSWVESDQLQLNFSLKAGYYATSILQEILTTHEPERLIEHSSPL